MKFLLLIYEAEQRFASGNHDAEFAEYSSFGQKHQSSIKGGNALEPTPTAKTIRVRNGGTMVTDGPFAETKEQLGGFYLIEASNMEQAMKIASEIPGARFGSIEVRPVMELS